MAAFSRTGSIPVHSISEGTEEQQDAAARQIASRVGSYRRETEGQQYNRESRDALERGRSSAIYRDKKTGQVKIIPNIDLWEQYDGDFDEDGWWGKLRIKHTFYYTENEEGDIIARKSTPQERDLVFETL